jgi:enamine deaminase RidA (YjgF/YER057c/UK114 family)
MNAEARIAELGLKLPAALTPVYSYVPARRAGDILYLAGHGPLKGDPYIAESFIRGKLGRDLDLAQGQEAARLTGLALLATIRENLGTLDAVREVVKVLGMVNCAPGFTQIPEVINGCSDLLIGVFGDAGRHARSAVGVAELPFGIAVEIEMIVRVA